jgi:integrase
MRRELALLRTAVNHCVKMKTFKDQGGRTLLHAADLNFVDLPAAPPPRDRWLTRAEASAFLAACQPSDQARLSREYRYIAMLLYTASRTSPVETLTWDRILLDRDLINFRAPGERITKKRRGYVPIGAELKPILERAYRERTSDFYLDEPGQPEAGWRRAAKAAGLVDDTGKLTVTPHVLRHTWATWAAQDGVSLFEIAGVLHDTIATVERAYAHHCPDHLRNAVDRNILAAAPPQQTDEEKIMAMLEEVLGRDLVSETRA